MRRGPFPTRASNLRARRHSDLFKTLPGLAHALAQPLAGQIDVRLCSCRFLGNDGEVPALGVAAAQHLERRSPVLLRGLGDQRSEPGFVFSQCLLDKGYKRYKLAGPQ